MEAFHDYLQHEELNLMSAVTGRKGIIDVQPWDG